MSQRVRYVGLGDLIRLTTRSIEDGQKVGIRTKLAQLNERLLGAMPDDEQLQDMLTELQAFQPLAETIDAVRHAVRTPRDLQTFCATLLRYVDEQGQAAQLRSTPDRSQSQPTSTQSGSGEQYHRAQDEMERLAWDLIHQS